MHVVLRAGQRGREEGVTVTTPVSRAGARMLRGCVARARPGPEGPPLTSLPSGTHHEGRVGHQCPASFPKGHSASAWGGFTFILKNFVLKALTA